MEKTCFDEKIHHINKVSTNVIPVTTQFNKRYEGEIKFINQYQEIKFLAQGSYGKVKQVKQIYTGEYFCFKVMSQMILQKKKKFFGRDEKGETLIITMWDDAKNEMEILKNLNFPYLTNLHEILVDEEDLKYYLVIDFAEKGALMTYDDKKECFVYNKNILINNNGGFSESLIKKVFHQLAKAIDYLHDCKVVHRDIKPDNLLLDSEMNLRLSDFSIASKFEEDCFKKTEGNLFFYSPELCQGNKTFEAKPVDIWAYGVCLYIFIYSELPLIPENKANQLALLDLIRKGEINYNKNNKHSYYSSELILLLKRCLEVDPKKRITSKELVNDNYFN